MPNPDTKLSKAITQSVSNIILGTPLQNNASTMVFSYGLPNGDKLQAISQGYLELLGFPIQSKKIICYPTSKCERFSLSDPLSMTYSQ